MSAYGWRSDRGGSGAYELLAGLVIEDGRSWAEASTEWQRDDAQAVLDLSDDAPRLHYLTRPRGGSKTTDIAGVLVAGLIDQFPARAQGYAFAVDGDQAALLLDAAAGLVERSGLAGLLEVQTRRLVHRSSGAAVNILSADGASAYGLRPFFLSVDEVAQWPTSTNYRRLWEAIVSAVPKVPGCRLVAMTSAGDPSHFSNGVLVRAKVSPRWRVSEVPGPLPWRTEEELEEQRALLTASQFARLHLNRWTTPEDRLTTAAAVRACVTAGAGPLDPEPGVRYVIGLDIGVRNDRTAAAVCSLSEAESGVRVVLDRLQVWSPSRERELDFAAVEEWLVATSKAYNGASVRFDPYQAMHLTQRLRRAGVACSEFTFSTAAISKMALTLYRLLRDERLDLPDDAALIDELSHVVLRETSAGVVRLDHDPSRHDDRAIALALAAHTLLDRPPARSLTFRGSM